MNEARILRAAAARGATLAETAEALGCSVATAWRLWHALGLPRVRPGPRPGRGRGPGHVSGAERALPAGQTTDDVEGGCTDEERILRAAAARGATLAQTAEALGCSPARARRLWLGLGLPMGRRGPRPGSTRPPAPFVAEVERALREGRTIGEVARDRGVSRQAISDLARRHGFPVRALRQSAPCRPTGGGPGSATVAGGEKDLRLAGKRFARGFKPSERAGDAAKDLRGVMVWVPGR